MAKPFLRWAGSKKRLIPELLTYWSKSEFTGYIEPFAGSAQLLFKLNPKKRVLGDINGELTNTYIQIKTNPEKVFNKIQLIPHGKESYYKQRSLDPAKINSIERSARFIFLNRYCFNGLYRTNLKGEFNVPFAGTKTGNLPTIDNLIEISNDLKDVTILNDDFENVVSNYLDYGDFVYLDPPYAVSNSRVFRQYSLNTFGLEDLERMSNLLSRIDSQNCKFLVSYADCSEAYEFFGEWKLNKVNTQRFMKGFGKNRVETKELLITNI